MNTFNHGFRIAYSSPSKHDSLYQASMQSRESPQPHTGELRDPLLNTMAYGLGSNQQLQASAKLGTPNSFPLRTSSAFPWPVRVVAVIQNADHGFEICDGPCSRGTLY